MDGRQLNEMAEQERASWKPMRVGCCVASACPEMQRNRDLPAFLMAAREKKEWRS